MARGGEVIEKINKKIKDDRGYVDYADINGVIKNVKYKNEYGEGYKEHKNVPIINALNLGEKMGLFKEVKDKRKPYKKQGYWLNVEDYAHGGEIKLGDRFVKSSYYNDIYYTILSINKSRKIAKVKIEYQVQSQGMYRGDFHRVKEVEISLDKINKNISSNVWRKIGGYSKGGSLGQGQGYKREYQDDILYELFYDKSKANYDKFYKLAKNKGYTDYQIDKWYEHRNGEEEKMARGGKIKLGDRFVKSSYYNDIYYTILSINKSRKIAKVKIEYQVQSQGMYRGDFHRVKEVEISLDKINKNISSNVWRKIGGYSKGGSLGQGQGYKREYQDDILYELFYDKSNANYDKFYKLAKNKGYTDYKIDKWYEHRNDEEEKMARGGKTKLEGWDKNNSIFAYAYAKDRQVKHDGTFEQFKKSYFNEVPEEGHYNDKVLRYAYDELNKKKGYARGGELLSGVDMYVKIHGYYPMEVMAMRGDGMGTSIVRNEAHNFELSGVDSRKAEEMGYEFDYDQKGWVEVEDDDDDFAKGGSIDDLDEIKKGDYVNFGEYGNFYVVDTDYLIDGTHFWVTRDKENRTNSQAPGYTILKGDAQYIIEKYSHDDDYAKGGEVEKKEYINKYIKDLGLDVEEMPARQYRYLSKQASRKYEKEKQEKMPYRKYRVSYRIPFGAIHSTVVDARTSNEARTIFRKNHGRDIQGNQDKILSVTLTKVKKEDGGDVEYAKGGKTKWIQEAIQKPGALRETAKRKGLIEGDEKLSKTDLKKLEKVGGKTGQRARLAATLKGLGKKKKMAKGGQTKFISLTTRKGQSEVEKYTNQGWGIKFQNDKFAILERGGKKKN